MQLKGYGKFGNGGWLQRDAMTTGLIGTGDYSAEMLAVIRNPVASVAGSYIGSDNFVFTPFYSLLGNGVPRTGLDGVGFVLNNVYDWCNHQLHHYVMTADRDSVCTFYVDGQPSGTPADVSSKVAYSVSDTRVYIGRRNTGEFVPFDLYIARIWKKLLSASEVRSLCDNPYNVQQYISGGDLVCYYDMKPVSGLVPDLSGKGNHGVINGPYQYVPGAVDDNDWWQ